MTVCVATLFYWNYAPVGEPPEFGLAAITASDQMITAGDIQYEPTQQKAAAITPKTLVLIAGDYAVHSEAIQGTIKQIKGNTDASPNHIALVYGQEIQRIRRRHAEDCILAPLGLNTDTFLAQQKEMSDSFANELKEQLQRFQGPDVAAIIVGSDGEIAHIYEVDSRGTVNCMDDVSFHAIGVGAWHAQSHLMQSGYQRRNAYWYALAQTYSAKRRAEVAPGVGGRTDIHVVFRDRWVLAPTETLAQLAKLYDEFASRQLALASELVDRLEESLKAPKEDGNPRDEAGNGEVGKPASEAAQGNESEQGPRRSSTRKIKKKAQPDL